jgi:protein TonB
VEAKAPPPSVITSPDWLKRPSGEDLANVYPERAQRMNVNGHAELDCVVTVQGAVANCQVVSESPADQQFGAAAMKLTRYFKMRPQTRDGQPVGGAHVRIPIGFVVPRD